jgi:RNA polymerase primary sigma factor
MNLSNYYADICKFPILTAAEELELLTTYFESDSESAKKSAKHRLISSNMRFVFKRAKLLSKGDTEQFIELISAGNEGLVVGLEKFDHKSGMRFLTYAGWWVYQRQMKQMSEFRLVSLPTQKQQLSVKIKRLKDESSQSLSMDELKEQLPDCSEKDLRELNGTAFLTFYMDSVGEDEMPTMEGMKTLEYELLVNDLYSAIDSEYGDDADMILSLHGLTREGKRLSYSQLQDMYPDTSKAALKAMKEDSIKRLAEILC